MWTKIKLLILLTLTIGSNVIGQVNKYHNIIIAENPKIKFGIENQIEQRSLLKPSKDVPEVFIKFQKEKTDSIKRTINNKYGLIESKEGIFLQALLTLKDTSNIKDLKELGVKFQMKDGNTFACLIPLDFIKTIDNLEYIEKITIVEKDKLHDIYTTTYTNSNLIQSGKLNNTNYTGKGTIIGIIDKGFDYTHPNFYDSTGKIYRIKTLWDQNENMDDSIGMVPSGYNYGREYTTPIKIYNRKFDTNTGSHGTHVTGLAAGSGFGNPSQLKGISYESDIAIVATNMNPNSIIDGIVYLKKYAKSVNKPISINISIGGMNGPHDGTSFYNFQEDSLLNFGNEEGISIIRSAGNAGNNFIHSKIKNTQVDSLLYSIIKPYSSLSNYSYYNKDNNDIKLSIYSEPNKQLYIAYGIINAKTGKWENLSNRYFSINDFNSKYDTIFSNSNINIKTSIAIDVPYPRNNKPNAYITIDSYNYQKLYNLDTTKVFMLIFYSKDNTTNSWIVNPIPNGGENPSFQKFKSFQHQIVGDNETSISEQAATKSIVAVGSWTNKLITGYSSLEDSLFKKATTSSIGNTTDDRIKPDVIAPGDYVSSSYNSWDINTDPNLLNWKLNANNRNYFYGYMTGTSMASPVMAGIVSLWQSAYPNLSSNQVLDIIRNTSSQDIVTSNIANNYYGFGRANAYSGMSYLLNQIPSKPLITPSKDTSFCQNDTIEFKSLNTYSYYYWLKNNSLVSNKQSFKTTSEGTYNLYIRNAKNYLNLIYDSIKIKILPLPNAPIIQRDAQNNLVSSAKYNNKWYKDGILINDTNQTIKPASNGIYAVKTSQNGCYSQLSPSYFFLITDLYNISPNEFINISPNPFHENLKINFVINNHQSISLEIIEISSGRIVMHQDNVISGQNLNVGNIPSGSYLIKVSSRDNKIIYQFKSIKI